MTERELNERLRQAVENAAPDDLEAILSRCGNGKGTVIEMKKTSSASSGRKRRYMGLVAACLALVLVAGGGGLFYQQAYAVASVISLDVNPSIELTVNKNEKVLSCTGLNEEGRTVLADMGGGSDLKGAKLDVAVNAIVGALVRSGYLDDLDSAILISVEDSDADRGARLQQELVASVDGVLQGASNQTAVLSQSVTANKALDDQAKQNNISTGKAYLVERVLAVNGSLSFDALAGLSVEELRDLLTTGAPAMPIGKDAALQAALAYAGLGEGDYSWAEVDPELDEATPYYEVELVVNGQEKDYGVHAYTGEVIQGANVSAMNPGPALPQGSTPAVTQADAEAIAMAHAGVQDVPAVTKQDYDDGALHWDVEFHAGGYEYEYEIDAATGAILSSQKEAEPVPVTPNVPAAQQPAQSGGSTASSSSGDIGADAAKTAALAHAGVDASQASRMKCEQDYDDGRLEYEIEFAAGGYEYEYTIDAGSGAVLDHERDRDD